MNASKIELNLLALSKIFLVHSDLEIKEILQQMLRHLDVIHTFKVSNIAHKKKIIKIAVIKKRPLIHQPL